MISLRSFIARLFGNGKESLSEIALLHKQQEKEKQVSVIPEVKRVVQVSSPHQQIPLPNPNLAASQNQVLSQKSMLTPAPNPMAETQPRDVQVISFATNTRALRARSWTRLRFEIEYALSKGTTSNSYLIQGDKSAITDPPPETFTEIYLTALRQCIDLAQLDYVILQHFNPNRLVTLKALLQLAPQITFVCTSAAEANLRPAFSDMHLKVLIVEGGETLDLGQGHVLQFITTPTARWPEALCTYDRQTQILYTDKLFASHVCGDEFFDEDWTKLKEDQRYYYDCLLAPDAPQVQVALNKLSKEQVRMYGVGHGPLIRYGLMELTNSYEQWSRTQACREVSVALLYASAYGNTATLAHAIALGLTKGGVAVESINCESVQPEQIRAALEKADGFIIGSPTIGGHAPTPIHTALGIVLSLSDNTKLAGVFGSYGWSGEAFDLIEGKLRDAGHRMGFDTLKIKFKPTDSDLKLCEEIGTDFAQSLRKARTQRLPQQPATLVEQAMGRVIGSLCVLTAKQGDISTGMMASWVSQATFSPPGLTVAVAKERAIESLMHSGGKFVLNILGEDNYQDYVRHFRKNFVPGEDRFKNFSTEIADNDCIVISDAVAYLECSVNQRMECGDHWLIYATVDNGKLLKPNVITAVHHRKSGSSY
jgi:flavorubredoxin/flavin reductase (DIM6/NTAB) family NADH-FMN oxidoreductase RutF